MGYGVTVEYFFYFCVFLKIITMKFGRRRKRGKWKGRGYGRRREGGVVVVITIEVVFWFRFYEFGDVGKR